MPIRLQAREVSVSDDELTVLLAYSRRISVPLAWFPRLLHATTAINTVKAGRVRNSIRDFMAELRTFAQLPSPIYLQRAC
jgi:hypothetical protein